MNKLDILKQPAFVVKSNDVFYLVNWEDFKTRDFTGKEIDHPYNAWKQVLDLNELDTLPIPSFDDLLKAQNAINTRIDNKLDFAHFGESITNPLFFYRIAAGFNVFNEQYLIDIERGSDSGVLIAVAVSMILVRQKQREHQLSHGVSIMGVFDDKGGNNHVYTERGELDFIISSTVGVKTMHGIIMDVYNKAISGRGVTGIVYQTEDNTIMTDQGAQPMRYRIVEVEDNELKLKMRKPALRQIHIADKNNLLPGEEGYDTAFDQKITLYK